MRRCIVAALAFAVACTSPAPQGTVHDAPSSSPTRHDALASPTESPHPPTPSIVVDPSSAAWTATLDGLVDRAGVSVAVGVGGRVIYAHDGRTPDVLASNEKLLTSMAALDLLGRHAIMRTEAAIAPGSLRGGVVHGDLWLIGGGDPTLDGADLAALARRLADAGITRVGGDIVGDVSAFDRGWWAPGWLPTISRSFVARPTALRLSTSGTALEAATASAFRDALVATGIPVTGGAVTGTAPDPAKEVASIASPPLADLLAHQNHESDNLYAELLTKALGKTFGREGSTAAGANVIRRWVATNGVRSGVRDGSGLSDQDRTSAIGVTWLLLRAERAPWFPVFERSLPAGGEGTLSGRLTDVDVRAKTGTLFVRPTSTLSGYVRSADGSRVAFSVLTHGLPQATAEGIEDAVVRTLAAARIG